MKQLNKLTHKITLLVIALFAFGYVNAQINVSGKLTDSKGQPLIAASVSEVGTTNGAYTEIDGTWTLSVKSTASRLEFSYVGYKTKVVTVGSQKVINVKLESDAQQLGTVVKIAYGSQKVEDVVGGISTVKGSDMKAPTLDVAQALQGKAAGVQVRANSGTPGAGMDIVVRGRGTTGNANPLYVVDGVPVGYEYKGDPSNIESISILKDASSCAMYGSRGANGVVLITTKGGVVKEQEPYSKITFEGYSGAQQPWKQVDVMSGDEFAAYYNTTNPEGTNTNWQDEIFQNGGMHKYKIEVESGSEASAYNVSGGYFKQEGIVINTGYEKYDFGFRGSNKLSDKIEITYKSGFGLTNANTVAEGNINQSVLGNALLASPMSLVLGKGNSSITSLGYSALTPGTYQNPVALARIGTYDSPAESHSGYGMGMTAGLNYKIIKGLTFNSSYYYNKWGGEVTAYVPAYFIQINQQLATSSLRSLHHKGKNWGTSNTLEYAYNVRDDVDTTKTKHAIKILGGHELLSAEGSRFRTEVVNLPEDPNMRYVIAGTPALKGIWAETWDAPTENAMISMLGRVEYGLMDKYNVNASIRRDASSRFGPENRIGYFPAVGGAWKINKEPFFYNNAFLKDSLKITMFKFRASWGKIGNESIPDYSYVGTVVADDQAGYNFGVDEVHETGALMDRVPNPLVQWEEATSWSFGSDLEIFNKKLIVNYDYFIKHNYKNLIPITVPDIAQAKSNPIVNAAEVLNRGSEISLTYRNNWRPKGDSVKHTLTYDLGVNFTKIHNEVTNLEDSELTGGQPYTSNISAERVCYTKEGYAIASFFGYVTDGIYQSWKEVNEGVDEAARPGDLRIIDVNGDGVISPLDKTLIGNPHPDFTYGLNANAAYAGFDFGFSFQGVYGNEIYNAMKLFLDGGKEMSNVSTRRLDVWSPTNTSSTNASASSYDGSSGYVISSASVEDGSYLRLKSVTLGYTLPETYAQKFKASSLRVYVQTQNLLTFTKYSGFDPEIGTNTALNYMGPEFGIDRAVYPQARSIILGFNLQF